MFEFQTMQKKCPSPIKDYHTKFLVQFLCLSTDYRGFRPPRLQESVQYYWQPPKIKYQNLNRVAENHCKTLSNMELINSSYRADPLEVLEIVITFNKNWACVKIGSAMYTGENGTRGWEKMKLLKISRLEKRVIVQDLLLYLPGSNKSRSLCFVC